MYEATTHAASGDRNGDSARPPPPPDLPSPTGGGDGGTMSWLLCVKEILHTAHGAKRSARTTVAPHSPGRTDAEPTAASHCCGL